jgi:hypothetical protein
MRKSIILCALLTGCTMSATGADLPLLSPPVDAATPSGFRLPGTTARRATVVDTALQAWALREQFFSGSGPTDLMTLLGVVDDHLAKINASDKRPDCLDQDPVRYTIDVFDHRVSLSAQCFRMLAPTAGGDASFLQFGEQDGGISLYITTGTSRLAAIVTPVDDSPDGSPRYQIDAWYGIDSDTACGDGCPYGVGQLYANPVTRRFEMTFAGLSVGFCGLQFASDGTSIFGVGSIDAGEYCLDPARLCVSASDPTAPGALATCSQPPAYILPALGRRARPGELALGPSRYPAEPTITLDGSRTDSLHFGPAVPTDGVGDLDAR